MTDFMSHFSKIPEPRIERWPKLKTIIEIDATRNCGDKCSHEKHYYISSLALDVTSVRMNLELDADMVLRS